MSKYRNFAFFKNLFNRHVSTVTLQHDNLTTRQPDN